MYQQTIGATYYRGGSSKAIFLLEDDIPPPGELRDALLKRLIGSPDPLQIDGMGGSRVVTSKVAIIKKTSREDADVDYTFAQVGITTDTIGYGGNCGNISSAVGPFAIEAGLIHKFRPGVPTLGHENTQEVRIFVTGTKSILVAHVPVDRQTGKVVEDGDFAIAGVPGTGAPILMDYSATIGACMGKGLLPTTNTTDTVHLGDRPVSITICDVGNPLVFVKAADLDMTGHETPSQINANTSLIHTLKELRGKACKIVGQCSDWTKVDEQSPFLPMVAVMSPAGSTDGHLSARLILDNRCHDSMAGTGAVCIAACSRIPGSVANQLLKSGALDQPVLQLEHQLGIIPVAITMAEESRDAGVPTFRSISFVRTARKIMTGQLHVPPEVQFPRRELDGMKHINGINGENKPQNITKALCEFVTAFKFEMLEPRMVNKIKELVLDQIGVAAGAARDAESSEPFLGAVVALQGSSVAGGSTVFTKGRTFLLQFAGFLNAAYVHTFDFDDTNAEAILHPGASVVPAVLAQGELANCDGQAHITAFAVAYEVSCRIGRGLGVGSYERGFHNTGTVGIFGAIAGIAKVKGLSTKQVEDAFGLAGSFASGSMQFLDNGSWNKRLHPALAVHNAFVAVAMAEAGVLGSSRPLEGKHGLFHSYSTSASLDRVTEKLGSEWAFASTAIKPFPACRMTHTSIEMVPELSELRKHTAVKRIRVELSPGCWNIVGVPAANKIHPQCIVDAQFSIYYQIAVCWLYGTGLQWKAYEKLSDEGVNALTDRIEAVANDDLITLEARIRVEWEDGHTAERSMVYSLGENENPLSKEGVHVKFLGLVEHVYGDKGSREIIKVLEDLENLAHAKDLMHLL